MGEGKGITEKGNGGTEGRVEGMLPVQTHFWIRPCTVIFINQGFKIHIDRYHLMFILTALHLRKC